MQEILYKTVKIIHTMFVYEWKWVKFLWALRGFPKGLFLLHVASFTYFWAIKQSYQMVGLVSEPFRVYFWGKGPWNLTVCLLSDGVCWIIHWIWWINECLIRPNATAYWFIWKVLYTVENLAIMQVTVIFHSVHNKINWQN